MLNATQLTKVLPYLRCYISAARLHMYNIMIKLFLYLRLQFLNSCFSVSFWVAVTHVFSPARVGPISRADALPVEGLLGNVVQSLNRQKRTVE